MISRLTVPNESFPLDGKIERSLVGSKPNLIDDRDCHGDKIRYQACYTGANLTLIQMRLFLAIPDTLEYWVFTPAPREGEEIVFAGYL